MSSVTVSRVGKRFGDTTVLTGIDLEVRDGETLVLLGPSGCGKTTLLRLIAGLDPVDDGSIQLGDRQVSGPGVHVAPEQRGVGLVFQDGALFPHLSVVRNIGFGLPRDERRGGARVDELCELVGLAGTGERMPEELSGGQQQRVALARALAPSPEVLLLDEPFSNLDVVLRERLRDQVRTVISDAGATAIFVTHDRAEAFALADRVALMRDGRVAQIGPPLDVYRRPIDASAAALVGDVVVVPGESDGDVIVTALGTLGAAAGCATGAVDVLARPEDLRLLRAPVDDDDAALVEACRSEGSTWVATVTTGWGGPVLVRGLGASPWRGGDRVEIAVDGPVWAVEEHPR